MENLNFLPEISEKSDIILSQLMKAKSEMGNAVIKDAANPFHKSRYASLGAHLELSEAILFNHGLLMLHTPNMINNQHILIATLHHPQSGQWIKSYLPLPNPKSDSQGIGSSLTYMRRYSINSMLGLTAEDDDGETSSGRGKYDKQAAKVNNSESSIQEKPQVPEYVKQNEVVTLTTLMSNLDEESKKSFLGMIKKTFNADSIQNIPRECFEKCIISLNAKVKYLKDQERAIA